MGEEHVGIKWDKSKNGKQVNLDLWETAHTLLSPLGEETSENSQVF